MSRTLAGTLAMVSLLCVGCYSAPVMPPSGLLYSKIEAPVSPAVMGRPVGSRGGESSVSSVLGLFAWGDASVEAAAREGGITLPQHIDYEFVNVLLVYQRFTTIVHGASGHARICPSPSRCRARSRRSAVPAGARAPNACSACRSVTRRPR